MPGILPMKVIKVGTSSQSRIAQACDRCRSKKIRCDGIRPCCSQCANVGFECRTSDKLSRRAFPRGYTESLEERVRQLETEVRELKDLLDEKDEKIDMLSRMHGNRSPSHTSVSLPASTPSRKKDASGNPAKEDTFRVQASPLLLGVENSDSYFMGGSSGRSFIESFKRRIQESGKSCSDFTPEAFLHIQGCPPLAAKPASETLMIPPRLFSDRCVNVYFQEWAPLFPVLHKPTFLRIYEEYVTDPEKVKNNHKTAQLYLVFAIASISSKNPDLEQVAACEQQWQRALEAVLMDNTMLTLQCLVLAIMYCTARADYKKLQHYKGIAIGLSHRLGLHQSQKRFSFGALTIETRKKVFWTLYTLDCFSAALLGLPKILKEDDIHAEYPADTDDEYVTEKGFQPTLPGEYTRLSSALALFRLSRILAKVLEKTYPAATTHELSMQQLASLEEELNAWQESLPSHLRLNFVQDKPSTDTISSRSPLLSLVYYYVRTLIYRPAIGSSLGPKAGPALISVSDSSKCTIQIFELLDERGMTFSLCLNKNDVLTLCGMALLYQILDLKRDSKMLKEHEKLVNSVIKMLDTTGAPGSLDFKRIAGMLINVEGAIKSAPESPSPAPARKGSCSHISLKSKTQSPHVHVGKLQTASISETDLLMQQEKLRRMTMSGLPMTQSDLMRLRGRMSMDSSHDAGHSRKEHRMSMSQISGPRRRLSPTPPLPNQQHSLDYLTLSTSSRHSPTAAALHPQSYSSPQLGHKQAGVSAAEWEALLGSMEGGQMNVYDAIYGGASMGIAEAPSTDTSPSYASWSPESWDLTGFNLGDLSAGGAPQSIISLSEESLSSGEDMRTPDLSLGASSLDYQHPLSAAGCGNGDGFVLEGAFGI